MKAYKYRLYPTKEQARTLTKWMNASVYVYNRCLSKLYEECTTYKENPKNPDSPFIDQINLKFNEGAMNRFITTLKKEQGKEWLRDAPSVVYGMMTRNQLKAGVSKFYENLKNGKIKQVRANYLKRKELGGGVVNYNYLKNIIIS